MPVHLLTTIGDALHNPRSCLDSVAFELARRHVGDVMTERQESAAEFPICRDRAAFDDFFSGLVRRGRQERDAIRCVQPFALHEELNRLSNLDKHRRLPLLAWYVDFVYFTRDVPGCSPAGPSGTRSRRTARWSTRASRVPQTFDDATPIVRFTDRNGNLFYSYRGYTRRFGQNTDCVDAATQLDRWIRTGPKPDEPAT